MRQFIFFTNIPFFSNGLAGLSGNTVFLLLLLLLYTMFLIYMLVRTRIFRQNQQQQIQKLKQQQEELLFENKRLKKQKWKNEDLLRSLNKSEQANSPHPKRKVHTNRYNFVTVLFADIQGFTRIAEEMNPEYLIDQLDKIFFYFDLIVEKYQIEKIKTIGDAYMCAGGLPRRNRTNPVEVILAALEMQNYLNKLHQENQGQNTRIWDLRIGIHTGGVIAGAIGKKKISYDIWGDTVNIASRMESSGAIGKVNISANTYEHVKDFFVCSYRGKMPVKYKGEVEMYFVEGIKPDLSLRRRGLEANEGFRVKYALMQSTDILEHAVKLYQEQVLHANHFHTPDKIRQLANYADLLCFGEKVEDRERLYTQIAATFLLTGYSKGYEGAEERSLGLLHETLPEFNYSVDEMREVESIMRDFFDGNFKQIHVQCLADAYYQYYTSFDFLTEMRALFLEQSYYFSIDNAHDWWLRQQKSLKRYKPFTETANFIADVQPNRQLRILSSTPRHEKMEDFLMKKV